MNKQLDILFINPNSSKESYQELAKQWAAIEVPFWSLLLAGGVNAKGFGSAILDCDAERLDDDTACKKIKELNPRLVCGVVYGQNPSAGICSMSGMIRLFNKLKEYYPEYKTGIAGTYISGSPNKCLEYKCFDFGFIGDGLYSILNLLKSDLKTDLQNIKGMIYRDEFGFIKLNESEKVVPQDKLEYDLPNYPWEMLPYKNKPLDIYRTFTWHANYIEKNRNPFATIYTSLGCVKKCQFCVINLINRTDYSDGKTSADFAFMRHWPVDWVLNQLDKLVKLGVKNIRFADELYLLNRKYYEPISDSIIERGYDINSWVYARCDTVKPKYLYKLQKAGVSYVGLGVESAQRNIRMLNDKGGMDDVDVKEVIKSIENAGINVGANYMVGFPEETIEDMQKTEELALELNTSFMNIYATTFFPGTPLWNTAKENNWEVPTKFEQYAFLGYEYLPLPTKYVSREDVLRFRDNFWFKYYTNENFLSTIQSKFGIDAVNAIKEQTKIKLKRKILE